MMCSLPPFCLTAQACSLEQGHTLSCYGLRDVTWCASPGAKCATGQSFVAGERKEAWGVVHAWAMAEALKGKEAPIAVG